jgi:hypothetical protein
VHIYNIFLSKFEEVDGAKVMRNSSLIDLAIFGSNKEDKKQRYTPVTQETLVQKVRPSSSSSKTPQNLFLISHSSLSRSHYNQDTPETCCLSHMSTHKVEKIPIDQQK